MKFESIAHCCIFLAEKIWENGEILNGNGCLVPIDMVSNPNDFHYCSSFLEDNLKATHFSREWVGKEQVRITLYAAGAFGATEVDISNPKYIGIFEV